jgi:hypothetical protein
MSVIIFLIGLAVNITFATAKIFMNSNIRTSLTVDSIVLKQQLCKE